MSFQKGLGLFRYLKEKLQHVEDLPFVDDFFRSDLEDMVSTLEKCICLLTTSDVKELFVDPATNLALYFRLASKELYDLRYMIQDDRQLIFDDLLCRFETIKGFFSEDDQGCVKTDYLLIWERKSAMLYYMWLAEMKNFLLSLEESEEDYPEIAAFVDKIIPVFDVLFNEFDYFVILTNF